MSGNLISSQGGTCFMQIINHINEAFYDSSKFYFDPRQYEVIEQLFLFFCYQPVRNCSTSMRFKNTNRYVLRRIHNYKYQLEFKINLQ